MQAAPQHSSSRVRHYRFPIATSGSRQEILRDLQGTPRRIHPKYFYDEKGALLFDQIALLPEYYPTRAEKQILRRYCHAIAGRVGRDPVLIEPGSGTSEKAELLLPAIEPSAYVPLDIAAIHVRDAAWRLAHRFPWLDIHAIAADYCGDFTLPEEIPEGRRLIFFPGSTIGNFQPDQAVGFLRRWRNLAGADGGMLIGVDLDKDPQLLHWAYNDSRGVTAQFNLNILRHVNRIAGTDFNPGNFVHVAFYNEVEKRIEMHLESRFAQVVHTDGMELQLATGERILTEHSYKYSPAGFAALAATAGWRHEATWFDRDQLFGVFYLAAS